MGSAVSTVALEHDVLQVLWLSHQYYYTDPPYSHSFVCHQHLALDTKSGGEGEPVFTY
jgi:hypothetical protein